MRATLEAYIVTTVWLATVVGVEGSMEFKSRDEAMAEIRSRGWKIEYESQGEIVVRVPLKPPEPVKGKNMSVRSVRPI